MIETQRQGGAEIRIFSDSDPLFYVLTRLINDERYSRNRECNSASEPNSGFTESPAQSKEPQKG